jgi:hypothetical protein
VNQGSFSVKVTVTDALGTSASATFVVTVLNVAPTVAVTAPVGGAVFQTGAAVNASASFTDPGTADTHTCAIAWGDGSSSTGAVSESGGAGTCAGSHAYTAAGGDTITFKVTDNAGAAGSASVAISVTAAPVLTLTPPAGQSANEGSSVSFSLGTIANGKAPYSVTVTWGDGTSSSFSAAAAGAVSAAHTYANDGSYTATVKVTDANAASATAAFGVTVANVAPAVTVTSPSAGSSFSTGVTVTAKASFSDAGTTDTHSCAVTWGDGASSIGTVSESGGAGTCTATHAYTAAGSYTITFKVTDNAGASTSASVTVNAVVPPAISYTPGPNATANEGASVTFNLGSFSGGVGPYTVNVDWGDGKTSSFSASAGPISAVHTYVNDRATPYTVTVKVTDSTGGSATGTFTVTVANVAPTVKITTPTAGSLFKAGASVSLSASFGDAGTADTHTCKVAWGDGTTSSGAVTESGGAGTCTGSHAYAVGTYTMTVTVTDNAGASATATVSISVTKTGHSLFQPAGGFLLWTSRSTTRHHVQRTLRTVAHQASLRRVLRFELALRV